MTGKDALSLIQGELGADMGESALNVIIEHEEIVVNRKTKIVAFFNVYGVKVGNKFEFKSYEEVMKLLKGG